MTVGNEGIAPKVSVCLVTYNQNRYLPQLIRALMDQETRFPFEVIVGDDASTDGSAATLHELAQEFHDRLSVVIHPVNLGPTRNYLAVHRKARGTYVAHMDGDDLPLPGKLQAQANVLDANPGCTAVWHRMFTEDEAGTRYAPSRPPISLFSPGGVVTLSTILRAGSIGAASSIMYRRSALDLDFDDREILDYYVAVSLVAKGFGIFLDDRLGVYRCLTRGMTLTSRGKTQALFQKHLLEFLDRYPNCAEDIFSLALVKAVKGALTRGRYPLDWEILRKSFSFRGLLAVPGALKLGWQNRGPHLTND